MTVKEKFITFGKPDISEKEEQAILKVLRSGWLGTGEVTKEFESKFQEHLGFGAKCVAVSSCTVGLYLCLKAEGIGTGDFVITSPLTFAATANAILATGAKPIFCEVDNEGCLDPAALKLITPDIKAVIPVHLGGHPCSMKGILRFAEENGLKVIEDAAHGFGGHYRGQSLGTIGDYGVFSFYPTKNITCGDGGMVSCRTEAKAERIRVMAAQGLSQGAWGRYGKEPIKSYEVAEIGFKGSMNDLSASLGLAQLERWADIQAKRKVIWDVYDLAFAQPKYGHSMHLFTVLVEDRDSLRKKLYAKGIGTGVHYNPLHLEKAYSSLGYKLGDFPMAEKIGSQTLSLPVSSTMTKEDAEYVVQSIQDEMGDYE